jgi:uncharacterized protein
MTEEASSNFVFNPDKKTTILSIDGGGMRGVIPLAMLMYLEEQTGKPAYDLFDMVGGTSTGAIIAAGLGLGMSAKEIMKVVYKDSLPKAFGGRSRFFWFKYLYRRTKYMYPFEPFLSALGPLAVGKKVSDIKKPIILMATKDIRTSNTYYITNTGPGAAKFADWPLTGAVGASGAAPIFFPPILGNLIDGGVGSFGNPCLATSIEAIEYIGMKPEDVLHISLGTGFVSNEREDGAGAKFSAKKWLEYIFLEDIDDAALQQVYMTRTIYRSMDFRRYNPDLDQKNVEKTLGVKTNGMETGKLTLDTRLLPELELMEAIGYNYAKKIDWAQERVMPWDTPGGHQQPGFSDVDWTGTMFDLKNADFKTQ